MKRVLALFAVLFAVLAMGLGACTTTSQSPDLVLPDGVRLPTEQAGECKDPVGDISGEAKGGAGALTEPAGIDIVAAESKVVDGFLRTKLTMAGSVASVKAPTVIVDQGNPGEEVSFELRAAPISPGAAGEWGLTLVTWKAHQERSAALRGSKVVVKDKTVSFDIPTKDLPPVVTLLWNFGASDGDGDTALLDDCNNVVEQTRGTLGPTTTTTAVPSVPLGQEQPFKTTSKVTVYEVQSPPTVPKALLVPPAEDFKLAVVRAQICATDSPIDARTQNFNVKTTDNELYPIWQQPQAGADPAMPVTQSLKPGECIRGWITFQIPAAATVGSVYYSGSSNGLGAIVWKV